MYKFGLMAMMLILHSSCEKEPNLEGLISTDFEGKFIIETSDVFIADQHGVTQVPVFDSAWIWHDDFKWIRSGQFIYYHEVHSYGWLGERIIPIVLKPDGKVIHNFNSDFGEVSRSDVSPAGNRLALSRYPYYVHVYSLDQDFNPILIDSIIASPNSSITWAPDGERFLFEMAGDTSVEYYVQASGASVYDMTSRTVIPVIDYSVQPYGFRSPSWSSDGSRVSFIRDSTLYIADANGPGTHPVSIEPQKVQYAAWSPIADELAYIRWSLHKDSTEIVIYDLRTATRTLLPETASSNYYWNEKLQLQWAKDGNSIAFTGGFGNDEGIWLIQRDGSNIRQIYKGSVTEFDWNEE